VTENERTMKMFCDQFTPPLRYLKTEKINNMPFPDAWTTSWHDQARGIGITTVCYGGGIHAFIEAAGPADIAADAGRVMAKALGLFREADHGKPAT
jgi:hypothetical protein